MAYTYIYMYKLELVLAAWMRLKYPHVAVGALASSAPILQFEDIVPPETFYDIVSNAFKVC
jgi:lysosomal Pro-X carboxypeptidase